jgi:ribosome biogenesis GTPase
LKSSIRDEIIYLRKYSAMSGGIVMDLNRLGWNEHFEREFQPHRDKGLIPARVVTQQGSSYVLICEGEYISGRVSGKFRYNAQIKSHFPAVGDWVGVNVLSDYNEAIIQVLFSRKSCFSRKVPISGGRKLKNGIIVGGSMEDQVLAANIDIVFIVNGLDGNFNLRRIERYLTLAYNCGAMPVIILNKADLCTNVEESIGSVEKIAFGVPVHAISVSTNIGMEVFDNYLSAGNTAIFIGSSGVGKSR